MKIYPYALMAILEDFTDRFICMGKYKYNDKFLTV
jgi:hypothetical protein